MIEIDGEYFEDSVENYKKHKMMEKSLSIVFIIAQQAMLETQKKLIMAQPLLDTSAGGIVSPDRK